MQCISQCLCTADEGGRRAKEKWEEEEPGRAGSERERQERQKKSDVQLQIA